MNPEIKAKWVAALRSGEYKQGAGQLRDEEKGQYCCLGVLCDLYANGSNVEWDGDTLLDAAGTLPTSVYLWAGLPDSDPVVSIADENFAISGHNDGVYGTSSKTFAQIAAAIEEQL